MKITYCKIGTQPALVVLKHNYRLYRNKVIQVRDNSKNSKYFSVHITHMDETTQFFFAEKV